MDRPQRHYMTKAARSRSQRSNAGAFFSMCRTPRKPQGNLHANVPATTPHNETRQVLRQHVSGLGSFLPVRRKYCLPNTADRTALLEAEPKTGLVSDLQTGGRACLNYAAGPLPRQQGRRRCCLLVPTTTSTTRRSVKKLEGPIGDVRKCCRRRTPRSTGC